MKMIKQCLFFVCLFVLPNYSLAVELALSETLGKSISAIEVQGNRYIESESILAGLETKVGSTLNRRTLSHDIQFLYQSGNYSDIKILGAEEGDSLRLVLKVQENPFISEYKMDGNEELKYKDLKLRLQLAEGVVFSESKLRADINMLRKGYLKKGFYQVEVDSTKTILNDGSIKLEIHVHEGDKTHIRQIRFVGNTSFSDDILADEVSAQVSGLMPWFSDKDVVDTQKFANDAQILVEYYQNHGYLDVNVESAQLSLTPDKKSFYLTFALHEGPVYTVSAVDVQGDIVPSKELLLEAIDLSVGEHYSLADLRSSIDKMSTLVGDEGYAFNNVTPLFKRDVEARTVEVFFDIEKGREVYIERIEIEGNIKTDDHVVRRDIQIDESERFSATRMKQTKEKLIRTQLYKDVRVSLPRGSSDNHVNATVKLEEEKTGSFTVGAGYSQVEKIIFTFKVAEKNFLGKGYGVNGSADLGARTQNFNVTLSDPYFMDENVSASLSLNKKQTKPYVGTGNAQLYTQDDIGGGVNFAFPISEHVNYNLGYNYQNTNLTNFSTNASFLLRSQAGKQITGELSQFFTYDTLDRFAGTTSGHDDSIGLNLAGVGGSNRFWEAVASSKIYLPLPNDFVFRTSLAGRMIQGYSGLQAPIFRRYSLGGVRSLRGFDSFGVSLRDPATLDPIGGDKQLTASLDLYFPFPYIKTSGIRGVLFSDMGTVWGSEPITNVAQKLSFSTMRASTGVGVEWVSPIGPITLSWAKAVKKQPNDLLRAFEFGLGGSF